MLKEKIVAITGSAGFIGSKLVKRLRSENVRVIGFDLRNGVDITDSQLLKNVGGMDIMIHLAGNASIPDSFIKVKEFISSDFSATLNMLELCRKCNARLIYASSSHVYGSPRYLPVDEMHPVNGINPYAMSKIVGEELCKGYYRSFGLRAIIVRVFNIYGSSQASDTLISTIVRQAKEGKIILRDPLPRRDYIYIDDVIDAFVKLCEYAKSDFEIFNIGTGESYSVKEVVETLVEVLGNNIDVKFTHERRINEIDEIRAEVNKARALINWEPRIDLKTGIQKVLDSQ